MKLDIAPGRYVLAVSGGVDSMVLLDILAKQSLEKTKKSTIYHLPSTICLIVAHFDHGIREDSPVDAELVKQAAGRYGLKFELGRGHLAETTSEAAARQARYRFLKRVRAKYKAKAIITAHHQDDVIETAFINLIRGSGRLGLSAIAANKQVERPLLNIPKAELQAYAHTHKMQWREDSTNQDTEYLRNYLRLNILPRLGKSQRQTLISYLDKVAKTNTKIDREIATLSHFSDIKTIDRHQFSILPTEMGNELIAHFLRQAKVVDFDSKTVNRLSMAIKTSKANSSHPVKRGSSLKIGAETASFVTP